MSNRVKIIWLYGRSGAGKTAIAEELVRYLGSIHLDGDEVRAGLNSDLGLSTDDRAENNRRIAEMAKLLVSKNCQVVISTILPTEEIRAEAKRLCPDALFVLVDTPEMVCADRDPKGLYAAGAEFIFEQPERPEFKISGYDMPLQDSVRSVMRWSLT